MTLRLITAPAAEPVLLADVKAFLRVDTTADDTLITSLSKAAREKGEEFSRRAFITQVWEQTIDCFPRNGILQILRPPLQSITSVKYIDENNVEATLDTANYIVNTRLEPGIIIFNVLPSVTLLESGAITVHFSAGYGATAATVPERIKNAIYALTAYWYENRGASDVPISLRSAFVAERAVWF